MAVVPMKRVTIYALKKQRKEVLEALQRSGILDVREMNLTAYGFERLDTARSRSTFEKAVQNARAALEVLAAYVPEETGIFAALEGRKSVSVQDYHTFAGRVEQTAASAAKLLAMVKEVAEWKAEILRRQAQIQMLQPWLPLDLPLAFPGTKKTAALVGTFPEQRTLEDLLTEYEQLIAKEEQSEKYGADFHVVSTAPEQTCVIVFCLKSEVQTVEGVLRNMGFARPSIPVTAVPEEGVQEQEREIRKLQKQISQAEEEIIRMAPLRADFKWMMDYYTMRKEKYEVLEKVSQQRHVFAVGGYVPEQEVAQLETMLYSKFVAAVEIETVTAEETPPVLLHNGSLAEPVESVLETYSLPGKGEIDPTTIMAVFYYVLFGLMLSDAAYGILIILACGAALHQFCNMEPGMRKTLKMFFYCGISTTFWGVLFGGYFGDAVTVISQTFFGRTITIAPLWFAPVEDPMRMLVFSFAIGIVHIFAGLGVKLYQTARAGDWQGAVFDVICWYLVVGGGVVYLLSMPMFVEMAALPFIFPPVAGTTAAVSAGVGALGILLFGGRSSKNPVKRLAKGLYALYGVTGYLSDILSYSRLLALGLATGVIATVFNKMGSMFGGGVLGAVLFTVIFLIGHTLNIGINLLGAYVHTNRLQFVEFFGKFYGGGGLRYQPYGVHTKYYKIEEESS